MQQLSNYLHRHTLGTLFYRKHTPVKDILETLALLAEGARISSLSRAKGFKEDTILRWLREAARHAEAVEDVLVADYEVSKAQVDALWTYDVGNKGKKEAMRRVRKPMVVVSDAGSGARQRWQRD